tara:strand:- start:91 stop:429 length:339 start_codon:yes stop_codon:yes gene_type:complete
MTAARYDLMIDQGADFGINLDLTAEGVATNLTGYSGRGQLRATHASETVTASFTVEISNPTTGKIVMTMPAATTATVAAGMYVYDLEIYTAADATVKRLIQGSATVSPEVTR